MPRRLLLAPRWWLGIAFYSHAGLLTGGTVGIAFLAKHSGIWPFGLVFGSVNLPFYLLGIWRLGWFHLRTGCAVLLVSLLAELTPGWAFRLNVLYAALFGGAAMGLGLLMLFRQGQPGRGEHPRAVPPERFGLRAGAVQMGIDAIIVLGAIFVVTPDKVACRCSVR